MPTEAPKLYQLSQYKMLDYFMTHVVLEIDLTAKPARSSAKLYIKPNPKVAKPANHLQLDGEYLSLSYLRVNDKTLAADEYELFAHGLIIKNIPKNEEFVIEASSTLTESTDLFGLYETEQVYLIKAETEGLRRVFYCIDRPDNLATYTTTIIAEQKKYPILLSNGKLIEKRELPNGYHSVTWHDDLPKPSYLFALVAGNLNYSATLFRTRTGRNLAIEFYVSSKDSIKCEFAKEAIKTAIAWDEKVWDLDCDLEQHMVAGVDKYASGASEPTGLNLFNTENLFATPAIKTDIGMLRVLEVVTHEYFHYWSGNRVTIRDWFNLPFKEGLTTFRAAMLFEELLGPDLARLINGKNLDERAPRQSSYTAVRSLYTIAAYEKAADIFRMMMLVVGRELFYKSISNFLKNNDAKAVTLEELLKALTTSTGKDLNAFLPWFTEPGIPKVNVIEQYNEQNKQYRVQIKVINQAQKPIPIVMGLVDKSGKELLPDTLLLVSQEIQEFQFENIENKPIPSLLRNFSASVHLCHDLSNEDLLVLMLHDTNLYNRCESAKKLINNLVTEYCINQTILFPKAFFEVYKSLSQNETIEPWILAELLTINTEEELIAVREKPPFELLTTARQTIEQSIATELKEEWHQLLQRIKQYKPNPQPQFSLFDIKDAGMRRLKEVYYSYQYHINFDATKASLVAQFNSHLGNNMTETISALSLLGKMGCDKEMDEALDQFYEYWKEDTHAINYWFRVQAGIHSNTVVARVKRLVNHPTFDILNPNKIYSLFGTFFNNPYGFHNSSGQGYELTAKMVLVQDKLNPPLAANLAQKFIARDKYDKRRQVLMLENILFIAKESTSVDVKNVIKSAITTQELTSIKKDCN